VERIVGSVGRYGEFDGPFLPTRASVAARWKRIDRASNRGEELPPVSLYNIGDSHVVEDRNRRVSVTHYQGMEMIDAEIVELQARIPAAFAENTGVEGGYHACGGKGYKEGGEAAMLGPFFQTPPPVDEKDRGVVRAVVWVTLGLSVLMTLLSVVLPP